MRSQPTLFVAWFMGALALQACSTPGMARLATRPAQAFHLLEADAADTVVTAPAADRDSLHLTLYDGGLARVQDARHVTLPSGQVLLQFPDVSNQVDGTTLQLRSLDGGKSPEVLSQAFDAGSLTPAKTLAAYVGKEIEIRLPAEGTQPSQIVKATLVSVQGGTVVRIGDRVYTELPGKILLPDVPAGLAATPTLSWRLRGGGAAQRLEAGYLTGGLTWQASYTLTLAAGGTAAGLEAWATVNNQTAASFPNAAVTVVAGQLGPGQVMPYAAYGMAARMEDSAGGAPESALDEFHRYDLGTASLTAEVSSQLPLFAAQQMVVARHYRFESSSGQNDDTARAADSRLDLSNSTGLPLARGRVLVYDADKALIGQDSLANTPENEPFHLTMGRAFDVVGQHTQVAVRQIAEHERDEDYRVTLRNHKDVAVTVDVIEHPAGDWTVTAESAKGTRVNANELDYSLSVPAKGEISVTYTVKVRG